MSIVDKVLPSSLQVLILSDNPINWGIHIPNFSRFTKLKVLGLTNTLVGEYLEYFQFSHSIQELSLESNQIKSLEKVVFPMNLQYLLLNCNLISTIIRPQFPTCLKSLYLTDNSISGYLDLTKNQKGEILKLEVLYLDSNELERFEDVHLPKTLQILNLNSCYFTSLCNYIFPASIIELSFTRCDIKKIKNISCGKGSQLKYLSLAKNKLRKINWKFPSSIETIDLSGNKISYLDSNIFNSLDCLRTLNLSCNNFETFKCKFNIKNIHVLDLSFNNMKSISLAFPRNCNTELRILNLSSNNLNKLTGFMIGHDKDFTFHNKLLEIDINGNKIQARDVEKDRWQFPTSLQCLFVGYTRTPDKFGYDIGKSIIYNKLCGGKKIDVPSIA